MRCHRSHPLCANASPAPSLHKSLSQLLPTTNFQTIHHTSPHFHPPHFHPPHFHPPQPNQHHRSNLKMLFLTILLSLLTTTLAISLASHSTHTETSDILVILTLFNDPTCVGKAPRTLNLEANKCYSLDGAQGLRVDRHEGWLKYNACKSTN